MGSILCKTDWQDFMQDKDHWHHKTFTNCSPQGKWISANIPRDQVDLSQMQKQLTTWSFCGWTLVWNVTGLLVANLKRYRNCSQWAWLKSPLLSRRNPQCLQYSHQIPVFLPVKFTSNNENSALWPYGYHHNLKQQFGSTVRFGLTV